MNTQRGGPPPRPSGIGLGLGIGVAVGVGGVAVLAVAGVVGFAVWRGPAFSRAHSGGTGAASDVSSAVTVNESAATRPPESDKVAPAPSGASFAADTLYTRTAPAVVRIEVRDDKFRLLGTGTGFFVSADGLIVTNHHVIENAQFAMVETHDGASYFVQGVAASDPKQDLALLKVNAGGMKFLQLAADERPPVGTRVFAVGHPKGVKNSVLSEGLVSGVGDAIGGDVASIQTTAPISPGSSGGPLVSADAHVVGVTSASAADTRAQNLNLAVPVSLVHKLVAAGKGGKPLKALASAGGSSLDRGQVEVLRKAWAAIDRGQLRDAAQILAEAKGRMQGSNAYWATAGMLHMELKNYAVAAEAYQNAVRLKGDAVETHAMLGLAFALQEKYREAVKAYEAASRLAPRDPKYYAAVGRCHMELKQPDRAVAFYKKATQLAPGDAAYVRRLGDAYFAMKQYADAMMAFEKSLKLNAADGDTHVALGATYYALRRTDDASASVSKGLSLNPRSAVGHAVTGLIRLERKDLSGALASYRLAASLDPAGPVGREAAGMADSIQKVLDNREQVLREQQQQLQQQQQQAEQSAPGRTYRVAPRARTTPAQR